ncbi:MAG: LD-carboxypeptidase [Saprospiraceae bacterium]
MNRRNFTRTISTGAATAAVGLLNAKPFSPVVKQSFKAQRLRSGQTVGLITPGSYIADEALEKAVTNLENLELKVLLGKHARAKRGYTAGTDQERLADLHAMFADREVAAIWCARGGYGCSRLLPYLDYKLIRKNPKLLIGYSDITALLNAIYERTGLVGIHGPVGASEPTAYTVDQLQKVLMEGMTPYTIRLCEENQKETATEFEAYTIREGEAQGRLVGGNLSLMAAMAGTAYQPNTKGCLVFLEDVGEKPYRIDRMLTQVRQSYHLESAAGIALGIFADCEADADDLSLSLKECLNDRLGDLGIPVMYGFSFGHIANQCTLPIGINARMRTADQTITLLETAVV